KPTNLARVSNALAYSAKAHVNYETISLLEREQLRAALAKISKRRAHALVFCDASLDFSPQVIVIGEACNPRAHCRLGPHVNRFRNDSRLGHWTAYLISAVNFLSAVIFRSRSM